MRLRTTGSGSRAPRARRRRPRSRIDLLDLDHAFDALGRVKEHYARIVELRYFAGLTVPEVAEVLGVGTTLVEREWAKARAYLAVRLDDLGERGRDGG